MYGLQVRVGMAWGTLACRILCTMMNTGLDIQLDDVQPHGGGLLAWLVAWVGIAWSPEWLPLRKRQKLSISGLPSTVIVMSTCHFGTCSFCRYQSFRPLRAWLASRIGDVVVACWQVHFHSAVV
jgi:hypothetical protein